MVQKAWDAVGEVAKMSQRTVVDCSNAVRYAAIGIRNKDKNDQPLEPYFGNEGYCAPGAGMAADYCVSGA